MFRPFTGKLHKRLCSFPRIPIIQPSLQNTFESLWRDPGAWTRCPRGARKDDGWCPCQRALMNNTRILHAPFPTPSSVKHYQTSPKRRIYQLSWEIIERLSFYFACSACLDWVMEILFQTEPSTDHAKERLRRWPWDSPSPLLEQTPSIAQYLSHACIHPACDFILRLLTRIHLHTLQYLCALVVVKIVLRGPPRWDHTAHKQLCGHK